MQFFSILQCKNHPLLEISKTTQDHGAAPFLGLKSQNIDHIPLPGDAVFCGSFNFHSYDPMIIIDLS